MIDKFTVSVQYLIHIQLGGQLKTLNLGYNILEEQKKNFFTTETIYVYFNYILVRLYSKSNF